MCTPPKNTLAQETLAAYYLYPSVLYVSAAPTVITTVLGTCVSVCLFDPVKKVGGMNHYMLPLWNGEGLASPKYGNIAIEKLVEKMLATGCKRADLQAKVFGGKIEGAGNVSQYRIGERNVEVAIAQLREENIPIVASSLKGKCGRRLQFNTSNGDVFMNLLHLPN